jgi:hypothetical protein
MQNRISDLIEPPTCDRRNSGPQPVGEILEELLAQYERQFPDIRIAIVETTTAV